MIENFRKLLKKKKAKRIFKKKAYPTMIAIIVFVLILALFLNWLANNLEYTENGIPYTYILGLFENDYAKVDIGIISTGEEGIVTLTSGCKRMIAYVDQEQAESIYRGIYNITTDRPNAHDIAVDTFREFGIEVVMVKITGLKDNNFYGEIVLRKGNKLATIDARPSDATSIALRTGSPIYVKNRIMEENSEYIC